MRIRLRPDHLGELRLIVSAHGNRVGIQFQASHEKTKKIIESSLASLKESLSSQNLILSQIDLTLLQASSREASHDLHQNHPQRDLANAFQDMLGQGGNRSQQNQSDSKSFSGISQELEMPKGITAKVLEKQRIPQGRIDVKV